MLQNNTTSSFWTTDSCGWLMKIFWKFHFFAKMMLLKMTYFEKFSCETDLFYDLLHIYLCFSRIYSEIYSHLRPFGDQRDQKNLIFLKMMFSPTKPKECHDSWKHFWCDIINNRHTPNIALLHASSMPAIFCANRK